MYRVAISHRKLIKIEDRAVTFAYEDSQTKETKTATLDVLEFIRRFLQHVLPPGFIKVRYFGIPESSSGQAMGGNIKDQWSLLKYLLIQSLSSQGKQWFFNLQFEIHKKSPHLSQMRRPIHFARPFTQGTMRHMGIQDLFLLIGCLDKLLPRVPQEISIRFPYFSLKLTGRNLKIIPLPALFSISICEDRSKKDLSPKKVQPLFKKFPCLEIIFS